MSKDISFSRRAESDSDRESHLQKRKRRVTKYQCPADFVSFSYNPCGSARLKSVCDENTELWLIKAPANFNPDNLSGVKVPLSGLEMVQSRGASQQIYSVLSGVTGAADLRLLAADAKQPDASLCAPAFAGLLNICESFGDCSRNQAPVAIPAAPAPCIPTGLRQRFQPFGSTTPVNTRVTVESPASVSPSLPKRIKPDPEESEESEERRRRRRKKKKKEKEKEKRIKEEQLEEELVQVKQEEMAVSHSQSELSLSMEEEVTEDRKKKKKRNKEKDREDGQCEETADSGADIKEEPMDLSYGDIKGSEKKKKKKKTKHE